ncbi:peptide chain release factor N(5)-glutamine methyltransferase [Patescibacteria group bacterium]|nr:peptide chain release factor N(5)-glutamine methyltransferase [Patescibacteria group bacterium]
MQIGELLQKSGGGLDAEVLLAFVIGVGREYLLAHEEEEVDLRLEDLFFSYMERARNGEPVAYIVGAKEFYGLDFYVDDRVLVPRPETEMLVEEVILAVRELGRPAKVLDVGTGSGCIAVSVAREFVESGEIDFVDAVDISADALEVARVNALNQGVSEIVNLFEGDLMEGIDEVYDVIVANLPYIGEETNRHVAEGVEKYEPKSALFGGGNGLDLYERLFEQVNELGFGVLIGEFCYGQGEEIQELLDRFFPGDFVIKKDLAGIDRVFIVQGNYAN